jgi:hypothetical protein
MMFKAIRSSDTRADLVWEDAEVGMTLYLYEGDTLAPDEADAVYRALCNMADALNGSSKLREGQS